MSERQPSENDQAALSVTREQAGELLPNTAGEYQQPNILDALPPPAQYTLVENPPAKPTPENLYIINSVPMLRRARARADALEAAQRESRSSKL